jgi:monofunctional biosynthetic peptidoglycan transglycosylase
MTSTSANPYDLDPGEIYGPLRPRKKTHGFRRVIGILIWVVLILHLYAIALRIAPVPGTVLMAQRAMSGQEIQKDWTPIENISEHLPRAIMGGEDSRFCEHPGIDVAAIQSAISDNAQGGSRRGGSTISQQSAKNVFLWNGGSYARKAVEAWLSIYTNTVWGKRRTMEIYLNVAEWGDGIFGAEAAAQSRFGKSAKNLTPREAALLAAVLPSPNKWRLDPPSEFVSGRAKTLMQRAEVIRTSRYDSCLGLENR